MLMIVTALYCEAQPLILNYHLKKNNNITKFAVFQNDDIVLIITNTGSIAAAVGVSFLSTLLPPSPSDILINIGVCGTKNKSISTGGIFLCNQILDNASGRSFYPDILLPHPFVESEIMTCAKIIQDFENDQTLRYNTCPMLFDMEAAGIYQAASYFYQPHQMYFLKIISDYGEGDIPEPSIITKLIEGKMPEITDWFNKLHNTKIAYKPIFDSEEETYMKKLAKSLQCSVTMEFQLRQLLHFYKLEHGKFIEVIRELGIDENIPCKTKTEGKMYFEQLKSKLI